MVCNRLFKLPSPSSHMYPSPLSVSASSNTPLSLFASGHVLTFDPRLMLAERCDGDDSKSTLSDSVSICIMFESSSRSLFILLDRWAPVGGMAVMTSSSSPSSNSFDSLNCDSLKLRWTATRGIRGSVGSDDYDIIMTSLQIHTWSILCTQAQ